MSDDVDHLASNRGSVDSVNVSTRFMFGVVATAGAQSRRSWSPAALAGLLSAVLAGRARRGAGSAAFALARGVGAASGAAAGVGAVGYPSCRGACGARRGLDGWHLGPLYSAWPRPWGDTTNQARLGDGTQSAIRVTLGPLVASSGRSSPLAASAVRRWQQPASGLVAPNGGRRPPRHRFSLVLCA